MIYEKNLSREGNSKVHRLISNYKGKRMEKGDQDVQTEQRILWYST